MFDTEAFKKYDTELLEKLGLKSQGSWALADNIFMSYHEDKYGRRSSIFFYDSSETTFKQGLREFLEGRMLRRGTFTKEPDNTLMVFYFFDCISAMMAHLTPNPIGAIRLASNVIMKSDGEEISWFEKPKKVN